MRYQSLLSTESLSLYKKPFWYRIWNKLHVDPLLLFGVVVLMFAGMTILYSASNQNLYVVAKQAISFAIAFIIMIFLAQIPSHRYYEIAPWFYFLTLLMLIIVLGLGVVSKGAQRWLSIGFMRFQPSELMKIAMPMMLAWYLKDKHFPLNAKKLSEVFGIILIPVLVIAKQPDLGTAIIIASTGLFVIFLTGISWRFILIGLTAIATTIPLIWHFLLHTYQKTRILTFLNPEMDPRGTGYHIIQSKIAIGSGGFFGKGFLHGTQTHLQFLPEHATDFIFAVCGEELGFIGCLILVIIFMFLVMRGLYISHRAQNTFDRLLTGSLTLTFFISFFVNIGMVTGALPVVGLPLPLVSYGGSAIVTLMAGFGIIMSTHTHRRMLSN